MDQKLVILLFVMALVCSCEKSARKDLSFSPEEYSKLGMPDYARVWTPMDYEDAWQALIKVKNMKPYSLPRKDSDRSGLIFNRIISTQNFMFVEEDSLQLYEKAYILRTYIVIQSELVDLYTDLYRKEQYYSTELIDLYSFGLAMTEKMLYLGYKINESDKKEDVVMKSAFPEIQKTYIIQLINVLEKQKNISIYLNEDIERLSDSISFSLSRNMDWMDSATKSKIIEEMQLVIDSASIKYITNSYTGLIDQLSK